MINSIPGDRLPTGDDEMLEEFLWWVCERQRIWKRRFVENNDPPWTEIEILQDYHFCNVHRELDYGTQVALDEVLLDEPERDVLFNTLFYRFFNKPATYRAVGGFTAVEDWDPDSVCQALDGLRRDGPIFGSAYRVPTHKWAGSDRKHVNIVRGLLDDIVRPQLDELTTQVFDADSLEAAWEALCDIDGVGPFLAYEIVCDLNYRHLPFSENDFVNVGPGAELALIQIFGASTEHYIYEMVEYQTALFDTFGLDFPYWDEKPELTARDFEHSLCEVGGYWDIKYNDVDRRQFDPRDYAQTTFIDY